MSETVAPQNPIEIRFTRNGAPQAFKLAGQTVVTDMVEASLQPYGTSHSAQWLGEWHDTALPDHDAIPIYSGPGWIGRTWRHTVCTQGDTGYLLEIEDIASYWIASDGSQIQQTSHGPDCTPALLTQTALGAPLVLALALRQTFCLHGSAVSTGGRLVLFIGESGDGKSTLATYLAREASGQWQRIIDDTLPVRYSEGEAFVAMPHFPQLKVPAAEQPVYLVPEAMDLGAVYVLGPQDPALSHEVVTHELSDSEATMALIQHTVGSRLFSSELLASHLAFCSRLAAAVPVHKLMFPRDWGSLNLISSALEPH